MAKKWTMQSTSPSAEQLSFLYASIGDMQATIRAIDAKTNYLMVVLAFPLLKMDAIAAWRLGLESHPGAVMAFIGHVLVWTFAISWLLAIWATYRTLCAIDNPAPHVDGPVLPLADFYLPSLYKASFLDIFVNREGMLSLKTFELHLDSVPDRSEEIATSLAFEQMKLAYIRTVKIKRSTFAYNATLAWGSLGVIGWIILNF